MITLSDFDPEIVARYRITPRRLEQALRYVRLMQGDDSLTLRDIEVGGYYGSSALLHEIVELDMLLKRDSRLLRRDPNTLRRFFMLNRDAHAHALAVEHLYLQSVLRRCFEHQVSLGALLLANTIPADFYLLVESDEPVVLFLPTDAEVAQAEMWLERLRSRGKELC